MKPFQKFLLGTAIVAGIATVAAIVAKETHLIEKIVAKKKALEAKAEEEEAVEEEATDEESSEPESETAAE